MKILFIFTFIVTALCVGDVSCNPGIPIRLPSPGIPIPTVDVNLNLGLGGNSGSAPDCDETSGTTKPPPHRTTPDCDETSGTPKPPPPHRPPPCNCTRLEENDKNIIKILNELVSSCVEVKNSIETLNGEIHQIHQDINKNTNETAKAIVSTVKQAESDLTCKLDEISEKLEDCCAKSRKHGGRGKGDKPGKSGGQDNSDECDESDKSSGSGEHGGRGKGDKSDKSGKHDGRGKGDKSGKSGEQENRNPDECDEPNGNSNKSPGSNKPLLGIRLDI